MSGKLSRDVHADVRRLSAEKASTLTADEIFADPEFLRYIQSLVASMTGRYANRIRIVLNDLGPDGSVAATDGDTIYLNVTNDLTTSYETLLDKFLAQMGIIFHEVGHILFLDFNAEKKAEERILAGIFYGDDPVAATPEEELDLEELMDAMENIKYAKMFSMIYHTLANIIADPHDEEKMMQTFGNYIRQSIIRAQEAMKNHCSPLEDMEAHPLSAMFSVMLQLARFGRVNVKDPNSGLASFYLRDADRIRTLLEEAKLTDDPSVKFSKINQLILILWPFIRLELDMHDMKEELVKSILESISNFSNDANGEDQSSSGGSGSNQAGEGQPSGDQTGTGSDKGDSAQDSAGSAGTSGEGTPDNGAQNSSQPGQTSQQNAQNGQGMPSNGSPFGQGRCSNAKDQGQAQGIPGDSMQSSSQSGGGNCNSAQPDIRNMGRERLANNPVPSSEQIQAVMDALASAVRDMGPVAATPENRKSAAPAITATQEAKTGVKHKDVLEEQRQRVDQEQSLESILSSVIARIAKEQAMNEVEEEMKEALLNEVKTMDMRTSHEGVPLKVSRVLEVTPHDIALYEEEMKVLKPHSKRIQRQMMNALRDLRAGTVQHRKLFGSRLEANNAYRLDQRFYSSKKLPQDVPDMAVTILVDGSGSMNGARNEISRRAAFLLHDFCMGLNIPVHVANHNTTGDTVNYNIFTDFDSVSSRDAYRISKMSAGGCNRDGMALDIAGNLLAKRPEEIKLLIIISDGKPNHSFNGMEYGGASAEEDIYEIVRSLKKKGVETIAAAIGSDRDVLLRIYREGYLDIVDLDKLPSTLASIVRKRIIP